MSLAHFWAGRPLVALPTGPVNLGPGKIKLTKRTCQMDDMVDEFWKFVVLRHFEALKVRTKWFKTRENIRKGDVVLLRDKNSKANCWPKAVVTKVHPGHDDVVRVVTVKNALGHEHERAVAEVVVLPLTVEIDNIKENIKNVRDNEKKVKLKNAASTASRSKRQSARLQSRSKLGRWLHWGLSFLICILCFSVNVANPVNDTGGVLVYNVSQVSRVMGEVQIFIISDFNVSSEKAVLNGMAQKYDEQCKRLTGVPWKVCSSNNQEIKAKVQEISKFLEYKISKMPIKSRKKRDTDEEEGAMYRLWRWLFGSAKSSHHSQAAMKHMSKLNQEFVLPKAKRTVKAVIHRCVPCRIQNKQVVLTNR